MPQDTRPLPVCYLDQAPVSDLARVFERGESHPLLSMLLEHRARILISGFHLIETGRPEFKGMQLLINLLKQCEIVWSRHPFDIFDQEVRVAALRFTGQVPFPLVPFHSVFEEAFTSPVPIIPPGYHPFEAAVRIAAMSRLRQRLETDLQSAAEEQYSVGEDADILRDPHKVIRWRLESAFQSLGLPISKEELERIIIQNGGPTSFPALWTHNCLVYRRLECSRANPSRNHLIDEFHASYSPYVAAMVLDHGMHQRLLETKLPGSGRSYRSMEEAAKALLFYNA